MKTGKIGGNVKKQTIREKMVGLEFCGGPLIDIYRNFQHPNSIYNENQNYNEKCSILIGYPFKYIPIKYYN
jgi:hypothetical protein